MKIAVMCDADTKEELLAQGMQENENVEWCRDIPAAGTAGCYIDLQFNNNPDRINALRKLQPAIIIVNAVTTTLGQLPTDFIRINGWPGFLKSAIIEGSGNNATMKTATEEIFSCFNKKIEWVADKPGFITNVIVSMIINEAYFALNEEVSCKDDIDTALKLGTNYPYGPFEWGAKIGLHHVTALLQILAEKNARYEPAPLLQKEAKNK